MKIGDLVRIVNEWVAHNPWMQGTIIEEETALVGLVIEASVNESIVLIEGKQLIFLNKQLEVLCK